MTETTKHPFDLEERTLAFSRAVIQMTRKVPYDLVDREIISQLVRSSCSIGANYREANDSLSKKDFVLRVKISRKEAKETTYWLHLLSGSSKVDSKEIARLQQEVLELRKILSSIIQKSL